MELDIEKYRIGPKSCPHFYSQVYPGLIHDNYISIKKPTTLVINFKDYIETEYDSGLCADLFSRDRMTYNECYNYLQSYVICDAKKDIKRYKDSALRGFNFFLLDTLIVMTKVFSLKQTDCVPNFLLTIPTALLEGETQPEDLTFDKSQDLKLGTKGNTFKCIRGDCLTVLRDKALSDPTLLENIYTEFYYRWGDYLDPSVDYTKLKEASLGIQRESQIALRIFFYMYLCILGLGLTLDTRV